MTDSINIRVDTNPSYAQVLANNTNSQAKTSIHSSLDSLKLGVDGDQYYSDLAQEWATKTDGKILGLDYSAKSYAQQAKQAEMSAVQAKDTILNDNGFNIVKNDLDNINAVANDISNINVIANILMENNNLLFYEEI